MLHNNNLTLHIHKCTTIQNTMACLLTDDVWSLRTHRAVTPNSVNSAPFDLHVGLDMAIGCNTTL